MKPIWFDVDGVLNNTPQTPRFWWIPSCLERLLSLNRPLVCISYWRQFPERIAELGIDCQLAPRGPKRLVVPDGAFVIDDQPSEYGPTHYVYAPEGYVGLTDADIDQIRLLMD